MFLGEIGREGSDQVDFPFHQGGKSPITCSLVCPTATPLYQTLPQRHSRTSSFSHAYGAWQLMVLIVCRALLTIKSYKWVHCKNSRFKGVALLFICFLHNRLELPLLPNYCHTAEGAWEPYGENRWLEMSGMLVASFPGHLLLLLGPENIRNGGSFIPGNIRNACFVVLAQSFLCFLQGRHNCFGQRSVECDFLSACVWVCYVW